MQNDFGLLLIAHEGTTNVIHPKAHLINMLNMFYNISKKCFEKVCHHIKKLPVYI